MMHAHHTLTSAAVCKLFALLWPASALAAGLDSAARPEPLTTIWLVPIGGLDVPVVTAGFAMLGVILSRPLSPKGPVPLSPVKNALVTILLSMLVLAWVIDSRPGLLFAFIMAIGLGFSGFAIIELAGVQALSFLRRVMAALTPGGSQ